MDVRGRRSRKTSTSYCWISARVCEDKRAEGKKQRLGKISACFPQRVAYCLQTVDRPIMSRQVMCMSTLESCELTRGDILQGDAPADHMTGCRRRLNTDPYQQSKDFEALPPDA